MTREYSILVFFVKKFVSQLSAGDATSLFS